jgi:endogenous inhibitor of DNA gyrase (YacG/DUF329 family)
LRADFQKIGNDLDPANRNRAAVCGRYNIGNTHQASFKRFCSKTCQDIHYQLHRKGVDVNRTDLEQKAAESVLAPLADYAMAVGMEKGLGSYSKDEIIGLVAPSREAPK